MLNVINKYHYFMSSLYCKKKKKALCDVYLVSSISFRIVVNLCVFYRVLIIVCFNVCDYRTLIRNRATRVDRYHRRASPMAGSARNRIFAPSDFGPRHLNGDAVINHRIRAE